LTGASVNRLLDAKLSDLADDFPFLKASSTLSARHLWGWTSPGRADPGDESPITASVVAALIGSECDPVVQHLGRTLANQPVGPAACGHQHRHRVANLMIKEPAMSETTVKVRVLAPYRVVHEGNRTRTATRSLCPNQLLPIGNGRGGLSESPAIRGLRTEPRPTSGATWEQFRKTDRSSTLPCLPSFNG